MIEGFFMVLYALIHAVPRQFVTLSWTIAALLYFLISILLKNVKYRYMALGTMICAAFYLFIVDLARIEISLQGDGITVSCCNFDWHFNLLYKPGKEVG